MGVDARTSIIRMLAQLVSHQVSLDISQLYAPVEAERDMRRSFIRTVRLGGDDIYSAIANEENRAKFADAVQTQPARASVTASTSIATPAFASMTALPERFSEVHADFLWTRREGLRQIGELIEMQMADAAQNQPTSVAAETLTPAPPADAPKRLKLPPAPNPAPAPSVVQGIAPLYDYDKVNTFALGRVADCYGERYAIYDNRRAPRIPNSELLLVTRAVDIIGERFQSKAGTSIHAEYDVPVDAWFYKDNAYPMMPYSVYMEIALQPSGFLSAYHGPTLEFPDIDFYFRNLDGNGTLYHDLDMRGRTITNHVTLTSSVVMLGTIIQSFKFQMYDGELLFYEGAATFGYHTKEVLSSQAGLDLGKQIPRWIDTVELAPSQIIAIDPHQEYGEGYLKLAHVYLEFTDEIKVVPNGGTFGAGYAYANTVIDPNAWFLRCHFHQDPVMPGSIGLETVMQALQAYAIATGLGEDFETPRFAQADGEHKTVWKYRGQILSDSEKSHVEANIKRIEKTPGKTVIYADASLWRDALRIYEAKDIALAIVEA
jgi:3-hydroxymyristoyl/3-hydroxydecanoyl-(acyl carrier protein) dehydratase